MKESIAVIIPVHNQARYLFRCLSSIYWQLEPDDQIIVVDDASSDTSDLEGIACFKDRVTWLTNPTNQGVSFSRNRAIRHAQAEWIKFLDADDILAPFALAAVHQAPPGSLAGIQSLSGACHRIYNGSYADFLVGAGESLKRIMFCNPMLPSATFVRRAALLEVGGFDERIDFEEDWDLWFKLHEKYGLESFLVTPQPFCFYWIEENERHAKVRNAQVEGMSVRDYFRKRYGATPKD